jgi:hypothetical protein
MAAMAKPNIADLDMYLNLSARIRRMIPDLA